MVEFSDLFDNEDDVFQKKAKVCRHSTPQSQQPTRVPHTSHSNAQPPTDFRTAHFPSLQKEAYSLESKAEKAGLQLGTGCWNLDWRIFLSHALYLFCLVGRRNLKDVH